MAVEQQDKSGEVVDVTLTNAISQAVETHRSDEQQETSQEKTPETKEEPKEEPKEDADELEQGRTLIRALKNPEQAAFVIDFLARQAGYSKTNVETKQDVKEAKADIEAILAQSLGEEFQFLAPKLGPAIKAGLEAMMNDGKYNSGINDLKARLEKQELKEIQSETSRTHTTLSQEWFGSDDMPGNVIQAMSKAMDEFPPSDPNMTPDRYYRRIFNLVVGELELTKNGKRGTSDKINRNRNDEPARKLASQNRGVTPDVDGNNPRKMTLKDAVSLALEQVDQASRK